MKLKDLLNMKSEQFQITLILLQKPIKCKYLLSIEGYKEITVNINVVALEFVLFVSRQV